MKIYFYQAGMGDCFLIDFENEDKTKFLIDCGQKRIFHSSIIQDLKKRLDTDNNYLFLTHIDDDHIGGLIYLIEKKPEFLNRFKKIYYNTFETLKKLIPSASDSVPSISYSTDQNGLTSYKNAVKFEQFALENDIQIVPELITPKKWCINDIQITLLSPSKTTLMKYKTWADNEADDDGNTSDPPDYDEPLEELAQNPFTEDTRPTNGSSLSLLIEYKEIKLLFLGDSFPSDIVTSLKSLDYSPEHRIKIDVMKVSHHGSKSNTSNELLELIECKKFLISTNGKKHHHPDKESLARIISSQNTPCLIFNYDQIHQIFNESELESQLFEAIVQHEVKLL